MRGYCLPRAAMSLPGRPRSGHRSRSGCSAAPRADCRACSKAQHVGRASPVSRWRVWERGRRAGCSCSTGSSRSLHGRGQRGSANPSPAIGASSDHSGFLATAGQSLPRLRNLPERKIGTSPYSLFLRPRYECTARPRGPLGCAQMRGRSDALPCVCPTIWALPLAARATSTHEPQV